MTADDACLGHLGGNVVLTPNPTEIAYCLHVEESEIEDDPAGAAVELAGRAQAVVGLGGARSWIAAPDDRLWQDDSGAAGLGVSGSGDVRAGITAGLLARGADPARPPSGPRTCTAGRGSGWRPPSAGSDSWPASCPRRCPRALAEIAG